MAARLSQVGAKVLVLEAGGAAPPETTVPGLIPLHLGVSSDMDQHLRLASQVHTQQAFAMNVSWLSTAVENEISVTNELLWIKVKPHQQGMHIVHFCILALAEYKLSQ